MSRAEPLLRARMPELDRIRGVAILMVVFFHGFAAHSRIDGLQGIPGLLVRLAATGWTGVNLFFVLSGFLITGILMDSKTEPRYYWKFYTRRALRIWPAYYVLLVLLILFSDWAFAGQALSWKFLGLSAIYLANVAPLFGVPIQFGVLWSLAVEEHFYLLWPFVIRACTRAALFVVAAGMVIAAALGRIVAFRLGYDYFGHYTWLVADGLAFGSLLAVFLRSAYGTRFGLKCASLGLVASASVIALFGHSVHPVLLGGSLDITALNMLYLGVVGASLLVGTCSWKFLVGSRVLAFFGWISYGLYLIHMLVFHLFDNLYQRFLPSIPLLSSRFDYLVFRFAVCVTASVLVATLSPKYFEAPLLRLKEDGSRRSRPTLANGATITNKTVLNCSPEQLQMDTR